MAIGNGASQVNIFIGGQPRIVEYNSDSKNYLTGSEVHHDLRVKLVSVGMLNANTRYGRAFDYEYGRTIPFTVRAGAADRTLEELARSLTLYAAGKRDQSQVLIRYRLVSDHEGQPRSFLIDDAWFPQDEGN